MICLEWEKWSVSSSLWEWRPRWRNSSPHRRGTYYPSFEAFLLKVPIQGVQKWVSIGWRWEKQKGRWTVKSRIGWEGKNNKVRAGQMGNKLLKCSQNFVIKWVIHFQMPKWLCPKKQFIKCQVNTEITELFWYSLRNNLTINCQQLIQYRCISLKKN